jgi:hypothetical protein
MAGDFEPHFSVKHMLKDVRIASQLARSFSLDLPLTEAASDMLLEEMKRGHGDADYSSVAQKYFPALPRSLEDKSTELRPPEVGAPIETKPEKEIPAAANLSGGLRGWWQRRGQSRETREDLSAL